MTAALSSLTLKPFQVVTEWVEITAGIPKKDKAFLDRQSAHIQGLLAQDVLYFVTRQKADLGIPPFSWRLRSTVRRKESAKEFIEAWGSSGPPHVPVKLRMTASDWEGLLRLVEFLDVQPVRVIRAALSRRVAEIREFERRESAAAK